jgi:hypothetical protein
MIIPTQMSAQFVLTISHNEPYAKSLQRQKCAAFVWLSSALDIGTGWTPFWHWPCRTRLNSVRLDSGEARGAIAGTKAPLHSGPRPSASEARRLGSGRD